jgi:hypothetical protein
VLKNRETPEVEEAVLKIAFEKPAHGQVPVSNELKMKPFCFRMPFRGSTGTVSTANHRYCFSAN